MDAGTVDEAECGVMVCSPAMRAATNARHKRERDRRRALQGLWFYVLLAVAGIAVAVV